MYQQGDGLEEDAQEAFKWYLKAAEQEDIEAQYQLGYMYQMGEGVDRDIEEAVKWYTKAAEQGYEEAQDALSYLSK